MKSYLYSILIAVASLGILGAMLGLIVLGNNVAGTGQRMYNCSIAEISPDFTPKMREECRKLRKG